MITIAGGLLGEDDRIARIGDSVLSGGTRGQRAKLRLNIRGLFSGVRRGTNLNLSRSRCRA